MAINKKLIHFKNKSTFNSKKLSANEANTQYQVGGTGTVTTGAPDINYQSIVYIKDSKEVWTHGTFYSGTTGSSAWADITGKPNFATVATSGSYNDLSNKPTIPSQYTLPTASSSTLGGIKVGNGLNINSGVLSVTAPRVVNNTVYNLVGYESGTNPLKNTPQLTFKSSEVGSAHTATLTIGDDPESGPSWIGALNLEFNRSTSSINTENPLSITSSRGDLSLYASNSGGSGKMLLSTASNIELVNSGDGDATIQMTTFYEGARSAIRFASTNDSSSSPTTIMYMGGESNGARFYGAVSADEGFFDTSDARVKTNVRELNAANADAIKLVEFDRTDIEHHGYGVIAQEVEKVYPSVVNTDADGFKSVNYNEIAMIKIKSLEDKVARLEDLVARLEGKLS